MAIIPATAIFALNPAHVDADQKINYRTPQANKIYKQAVCPVHEAKYDLEEAGLATCLQVRDDQITQSMWEAIFSIPELLNATSSPHNHIHMLMMNYYIVTKSQLINLSTHGLAITIWYVKILLTPFNV